MSSGGVIRVAKFVIEKLFLFFIERFGRGTALLWLSLVTFYCASVVFISLVELKPIREKRS